MSDAELFALRDAWLEANPWFRETCKVIDEYERMMRRPYVIVTQHWRDGKLVKEEREVQE